MLQIVYQCLLVSLLVHEMQEPTPHRFHLPRPALAYYVVLLPAVILWAVVASAVADGIPPVCKRCSRAGNGYYQPLLTVEEETGLTIV